MILNALIICIMRKLGLKNYLRWIADYAETLKLVNSWCKSNTFPFFDIFAWFLLYFCDLLKVQNMHNEELTGKKFQ